MFSDIITYHSSNSKMPSDEQKLNEPLSVKVSKKPLFEQEQMVEEEAALPLVEKVEIVERDIVKSNFNLLIHL